MANYTYKFAGSTPQEGVIRLEDGAMIPADEGNRDYIEYLEFVDGGGSTDPWRTAEQELEAQKADISSQRYDMEVADLVYDGSTFLMTREHRTSLDQAIDKIRRGVVLTIRWKCKDGYYDLNSSNIDALELAAITQVQDSFNWEETQIQGLG